MLESYGGEEVECTPSEEGGAASVERAEIADEMREAGAALEEAIKTKEDCQDRIAVLAAELRDVGEKLPKVEAEKKAHAAARRFKDAAASAAALKILTLREEEIGSESEVLSGNLTGMDGDVDASRARVAVATKRLNATEKTSDIARLEHMLRRVAVLKKAVASVGRVTDSSGGLVALAGPSEAFIAAEMATHEAAAVALRAKHDLSEEEWDAIESKAIEGLTEDLPEIEEDGGEGEGDGDDGDDDDDDDGDDVEEEEEKDGQEQGQEQTEEGVVAAEDVGADAEEGVSSPAPAPETEPEALAEAESESTPKSEPATKEEEDALIVNNEEVRAALEEQTVALEAKIDVLVDEEDYDGADVAQQELDSLRDKLSKL